MKVLVGCEFSGTVRDAFLARGHNAWSCDLLPASGRHICGDVLDVLDFGWDLAIFHPPCDHLAVSGARWFKQKREDGRQQQGINFFMKLINAPIDKIAVENPIGIMSSIYRKPSQILQPWQYGHKETKSTCLWLKNLPNLKPTNIVGPPPKNMTQEEKRQWNRIHYMPPSHDRGLQRSIFYTGFAEAMAEQWG